MKKLVSVFCLLVFLLVGSVGYSQIEVETEGLVEVGKYEVKVEIVYNSIDMAKVVKLINVLNELEKELGSPCGMSFNVRNAIEQTVIYFDCGNNTFTTESDYLTESSTDH